MSRLSEVLRMYARADTSIPKELKRISEVVDFKESYEETESKMIHVNMRATIEYSSLITQELFQDKWAYEDFSEMVRRNIVNQIFGEFRSDIHELYNIAYRLYDRELIEAIKRLEDKMFGE